MVAYTVWMLEKANINVVGSSLDGVTQGDASHLLNRTITLTSGSWKQTVIDDNDASFDDNDASQTLSGTQTINGVQYLNGVRVEAEYRIVLRDPATGKTWTAYGYNVNNSNPAFATVEGLVLRPDALGNFPPVGVPLTVTAVGEGPSGVGANPYTLYDEPPCFTLGTMIATPTGQRRIEHFAPGDLVTTRDHGPQPVRWVGRVDLSAAHVALHPEHRPVSFGPGSLGVGLPTRTLRLSPQHRVLVGGWKAEILYAEEEVLVPAIGLVNDATIQTEAVEDGVTYLHLLLDRHEIVFAEGAEVESLHSAWLQRTALPGALRAELEAVFPELFEDTRLQELVRPCLTVQQVHALSA